MDRQTERQSDRQRDSHLHVHRDIIQLHLVADDGFSSELQHFLSRRLLKKHSDLSRIFFGARSIKLTTKLSEIKIKKVRNLCKVQTKLYEIRVKRFHKVGRAKFVNAKQ